MYVYMCVCFSQEKMIKDISFYITKENGLPKIGGKEKGCLVPCGSNLMCTRFEPLCRHIEINRGNILTFFFN